jgi:Ca2+-binding RTX toxin-like protein
MPRIANDLLTGTTGDDVLTGIPQSGTAFLVERIFGFFGNDEIRANLLRAVSAEGGYGSDTLIGSALDDTLAAGGRNTTTVFEELDLDEYGVGLKNFLSGLSGNDRLYTSYGDDSVIGGSGNDIIQPFPNVLPAFDDGAGFDTLFGGSGNDAILGGTEKDLLDGEKNNDTLFGGGGVDLMRGGEGADVLVGDYSTGQVLVPGNPFVRNLSRFPTFYGDSGDGDNIDGQKGRDTISGGIGQDILKGGDGDDLIFGDLEKDKLLGDKGNDSLYGGDQDDVLEGSSGNDLFFGGAGNDKLLVGYDSDTASGDAGNDIFNILPPSRVGILQSAPGVPGPYGLQQLTGGAGADRYEFLASRELISQRSVYTRTITWIKDFNPREDKILLELQDADNYDVYRLARNVTGISYTKLGQISPFTIDVPLVKTGTFIILQGVDINIFDPSIQIGVG